MQKIIFIGGFILLCWALQAQNPVGIILEFSDPNDCNGSITMDIDGDACGNCELRLFKDRDSASDPDSPDNSQPVTNGSQAVFDGLCPGTYYLVLYNADFDCYYYYDDPVVIEECALSILDVSKEDENCGEDGSITVTISDSHPSYTYELIKDGSIVQTAMSDDLSYTFSNLSDGDYTVNVRNTGSCEVSQSITIGEGDNELSIDSANATPSECEFTNDGTITLSVSGGDGNYFYAWGTGGLSAGSPFTIANLAPGIYNITVSSGGCSAVTTAEVEVAEGGNCDPPIGDCEGFSVEIINNCDKFILLTAMIDGGTPPYTYTWTEDGNEISTSSSVDIGGISLGIPNSEYCVEVSDSAGLCTTSDCKTIQQMYDYCYGGNSNLASENRSNSISNQLELIITPNPFSNVLSIELRSPTNQKASLELINIDGRKIYQTPLDLTKGENFKKIETSNWSSGVYQVIVRAANGNTKVEKVIKID